jgi:hypothetical protein
LRVVRKEERKEGWMDGWISVRAGRWVDACVSEWVIGSKTGWMDGLSGRIGRWLGAFVRSR